MFAARHRRFRLICLIVVSAGLLGGGPLSAQPPQQMSPALSAPGQLPALGGAPAARPPAAAPPAATPPAATPPAGQPSQPQLQAPQSLLQGPPAPLQGPPGQPALPSINPSTSRSIIHKINSSNERIELTVNTSRILTLDQKIPQAQVNNPDLLDLHPLSPTEIQVFGKAPGVTQVNLWGENQKIYTVDVIVYGDAQALTMTLRLLYPHSAIRVIPVASGVILSGYVDQPENVARIIEIAQEYYPKVLNNMKVAGVQEVYLHVKVMEVSRTKLRQLGFDFAKITNGTLVYSGIAGLITAAAGGGSVSMGGANFGVTTVDGSSSFFGVLNALRQDNLMKVLAEPTLVTVSGRPAFFQVGGEIPIIVPQSLGTSSIDYKKYGTQVDFVPIVLGNGRIRLEVRPRVSEIDSSVSVNLGNGSVPGLRVREVETGVEMMAGQTLAIAGLVQTRVESENVGFPVLSEVPYLGTLFRRVKDRDNEVELLILVTPELVEAQDCSQVPACGPGMRTTSPDDCELYLKGHLEVPNCCPTGGACATCPGGPANVGAPTPALGDGPAPEMILTPSEAEEKPRVVVPESGAAKNAARRPAAAAETAPLPGPAAKPAATEPTATGPTATGPAATGPAATGPTATTRPAGADQNTPSTPRNRYTTSKPQEPLPVSRPERSGGEPSFIGPIGYDVK